MARGKRKHSVSNSDDGSGKMRSLYPLHDKEESEYMQFRENDVNLSLKRLKWKQTHPENGVS